MRVKLKVSRPQEFVSRTTTGTRGRLQLAGQRATHRAGFGLQQDLRTAMRSQRLGGLANTIKLLSDQQRNIVHPRGGGWSVSSFVYAEIKSERTAGALQSYLGGAQIVPKHGRWLAIAMPSIPNRVGKKRMTPALYVSGGFESRIGPLQFVPGKHGGIAYLIVNNTSIIPNKGRSAKRLNKTGKPGKGRAQVSIVAFTLIRATRRSRRVDPKALADRWYARMPELLRQALSGMPAASPRSWSIR